MHLLNNKNYQLHKENIETFSQDIEDAFEIGKSLDLEINSTEGEHEKVLHMRYLKALRSLQSNRKNLKKTYYKEVLASIHTKNNSYLLVLIEDAQSILNENSKIKNQVLAYAKTVKMLKEDPLIKDLQAEKELDDRSYVFMQKMKDEYEAYQEVVHKEQALKLRQLLVAKKKGGVIVYAQENKGDIEFYIENLFEMHVSASLFIQNIKGYETRSKLPYKLVLGAKEKRKVLRLHNTTKKKGVGHFSSHISWVKGSVDAIENKDFLYALPFHNSQRVSQGFNGKTSHKGNAKYAVDFAMDIGTPVYAARGGKVVELVQRHTQHGMDLSMRQYANYIIIEHSDKTLGRYFHLKQNGAKVKLADKVKQGDLIALSGNTGRTSGAHLHFVVTKAQSVGNEYKSISLPIKFVCSNGVLEEPIRGETYCTKE
ncbi:M23 family metallopeptidase [Sulfurimonas sp. MAG313]|nr:M23 family metallopeptidase [Sulfurimonas sp. MAG313]MDF1879928.1 M23 family metallopeptidase [Sulfurimonas sp. MAG313]